ncbi:hypothetical protein CRYUN_Cryun31cG0054900 [Craigia yunnanensis]
MVIMINLDMGVKDSGKLSLFGDHNGGCQKNRNLTFGGFDEVEEEEEKGEDCSDADDNFMVLNSCNGNRLHTEDVWRVGFEEDEFRHPLVIEICRLIQLRSAWNPKLESDLRHLLRSLKPRQVCVVLFSQVDERVALQFFYWADRQWRGIECRPEPFGYLMVSYSRAGNLRNAMKVLTLMQKAGVELNLAVCNTAIHVLVMANRLEKALRFFERMQIVGIIPNVVTTV